MIFIPGLQEAARSAVRAPAQVRRLQAGTAAETASQQQQQQQAAAAVLLVHGEVRGRGATARGNEREYSTSRRYEVIHRPIWGVQN